MSSPPIFYSELPAILDEVDSRHCTRVLRLKTGDHIRVLNGKGNLHLARITSTHPKQVEFEVIEERMIPELPYRIHIAISPTKQMDRIEWFVEKATELGINQITFLKTEHSERKAINLTRLEKKVISSLKQSGNAYKPELEGMIDLKSFLNDVSGEEKYIAHVDPDRKMHLFNAVERQKNYVVLIGPEGDFSDSELEQALESGFIPVTLGPHTLRTETAGLMACHSLHLVNL